MKDEKLNNSGTQLTNQLINRLTTLLFYLSILTFIIGFNFTDVMVGNWYQQFMPNLNGRSVTDVFFLDSLTGWAVTNATNQNPDTTYVLKTINGGDNWVVQYRKPQTGGGFSGYFRVYFLNQNTGYACDVLGIYKTTDGGMSWVSLNAPLNAYLDMSVLNTDTIWIVNSSSLAGGVFRTTNGGGSWDRQLDLGSQNPAKIYMYNKDIGFIAKNTSLSYIRKTTNSGMNWDTIVNGEGFVDMYFTDGQTGWKSYGNMKKTTDGGLNWTSQVLPFGGNVQITAMYEFSNHNKDTIWGVGGEILQGSLKGMVYVTTNGGNNWLFQVPQPNPNIPQYIYNNVKNKNYIWCYTDLTTRGVHTTTGGDTSFLPVNQISSEVPEEFKLNQNYPNPFNPFTKFRVEVSRKADVKVIVYDIAGRLIERLVDRTLDSGEYEITFNAKHLSSGVYLYSLIVEGRMIDTKRMILVK